MSEDRAARASPGRSAPPWIRLWSLYQGVVIGGADAVLAASIFHFGEFTVGQTRDYLRARGVPAREGWRRACSLRLRTSGRGRDLLEYDRACHRQDRGLRGQGQRVS